MQDGDWFAALDRLIRSSAERRRLRRRAKGWTRDELIDVMGRSWEDAFLDLLDRAPRAA